MPATLLDRRAFLLLGAASLALSACGVLGPPDASQIYVLKPKIPAYTGAGAPVTYRIAVDLPDAPDYLDTDRIAIERGVTGDFYANAVWQERVPRAVQRFLIEALEGTRRVPVVSASSEGLRSDYFLKTEIREFTAHYDTPDSAPRIVVKIEAKMVAGFGAKTVASTIVEKESQMIEDSLSSAIEGFNAALANALYDLALWALTIPPPPKN